MGGAGSMLGAITSLKNNRNARRSKQKGYKEGYDGQTLTKQKLIKKHIPLEELRKIKKNIREKIKRERRVKSMIFLLSVSIVTILLLIL